MVPAGIWGDSRHAAMFLPVRMEEVVAEGDV